MNPREFPHSLYDFRPEKSQIIWIAAMIAQVPQQQRGNENEIRGRSKEWGCNGDESHLETQIIKHQRSTDKSNKEGNRIGDVARRVGNLRGG